VKLLVLHLLLAAVWAGMTSSATLPNLALGLAVGHLVLRLAPGIGWTSPFPTVLRSLRFGAFLVGDVIRSAVRVAREVARPRLRLRPAVFAVPLDARTDVEIALLANVITLTPGTISLGVSPDRRTLWVHSMSVDDPDAARRQIKVELERRILELTR
jgi:multicomponent Na+:H+ antiporter subunit E